MLTLFHRNRNTIDAMPMNLKMWLKEKIKSQRFVVWAQSGMKCRKLQAIDHNEIYGSDYYQMVDETTGRSAQVMANTIVETLHPQTVIDMGCGTGNLIAALRDLGVTTQGLEFSKFGLDYCQQRKLNVIPMDFTVAENLSQSLGEYDLAVSMEVAIQLPPQAAKDHIRFLCQHAPIVLFSSPPCANDRRPQSPQLAEYWIKEFSRHQYGLEAELSEKLRAEWKEKDIAAWFYRQPMIFKKLV